jgi:uncharacterized protein YraI
MVVVLRRKNNNEVYIPNFMTIDTGVEAVLRSCNRNLKGCNIGITDGRDL